MHLIKTNISQRFSQAAKTYDKHAVIHTKIADKLITLLPTIKYRDVLEIGCGTGILTQKLLQNIQTDNIKAIDIASGMLEIAKKKLQHKNVEFICADFQKFHTAKTFDLLISSSALHWLQPLDQTIQKMAVYLKPNGNLLFCLMLDQTLAELNNAALKCAPQKLRTHTLPDKNMVLDYLTRANFEPLKIDREKIQLLFPNAKTLLKSIHEQGLTVTSQNHTLTKNELRSLLEFYNQNYNISGKGVFATYDIMYCLATIIKPPHCIKLKSYKRGVFRQI